MLETKILDTRSLRLTTRTGHMTKNRKTLVPKKLFIKIWELKWLTALLRAIMLAFLLTDKPVVEKLLL